MSCSFPNRCCASPLFNPCCLNHLHVSNYCLHCGIYFQFDDAITGFYNHWGELIIPTNYNITFVFSSCPTLHCSLGWLRIHFSTGGSKWQLWRGQGAVHLLQQSRLMLISLSLWDKIRNIFTVSILMKASRLKWKHSCSICPSYRIIQALFCVYQLYQATLFSPTSCSKIITKSCLWHWICKLWQGNEHTMPSSILFKSSSGWRTVFMETNHWVLTCYRWVYITVEDFGWKRSYTNWNQPFI